MLRFLLLLALTIWFVNAPNLLIGSTTLLHPTTEFSPNDIGYYNDSAPTKIITQLDDDCNDPYDINITDIGCISARVNFQVTGVDSVDISIQLASDNSDPSVYINTYSFYFNPYYVFNNLYSNTQYKVAIRSVCGNEIGDWSNYVYFTTPSSPLPLPYTESFEEGFSPYGDHIGECVRYERIAGQGVFEIWSNSTYAFEGTFFGILEGNDQHQDDSFHLPFELDAGVSYNFEIVARASAADNAYIKVGYGTTPVSATMNQLVATYLLTEEYKTYTSNFTPTSSGLYYIGVNATSYNNTDIYIDNIKVKETPDCLRPYNLVAQNITSNSVQVDWTADDYTAEWEILVQQKGLGDPVNAGGNYVGSIPYTVNYLTPFTEYEVYMRTNCSTTGSLATYSEWSYKEEFTTACAPFIPPYTENFDYGYSSGQPVVACFEQENSDPNTPWKAYYNSYDAHSENYYAYSSGEDWLFVPVELIADTSYFAQVIARKNGGSPSLTLAWGNMPNSTAMTNTLATSTLEDYYKSADSYFSVPTSGTYYVGIKADNSGSYTYIDDITIDRVTCLRPTDVSVQSITHSSAQINWSPSQSGETEWEYIVQPITANYPTTSGIAASSNTVTATDLIQNTDYEVYVRAKCSPYSFSHWSPVTTFTTTCNAYEIPYSEDFDEGYESTELLTGCFQQENIALSYPWKAFHNSDDAYSDTGYAYNGGEDWLFIPLHLELGEDYRVDVHAKKNGDAANLTLAMGNSPNSSAMTNISNVTQLSNVYDQINAYFIPQNSGIHYLGIKANNTNAYTYIDNIKVDELYCSAPLDITIGTVTANTIQVNWNSTGEQNINAWEIAVKNLTTNSTSTVSTNLNSYTLSNLEPNTNYEVSVRTTCIGSIPSPWSISIPVTTHCTGYPIPYFEGFEDGFTNYELLAGCFLQENINLDYPWKSFSDTDNPNTGSGYAYNGGTDWLFFPVELTQGTYYNAEVYARKDGNLTPTITLSYGTLANSSNMTTIVNATTLTENYQSIQGGFSPTTTGTYYIGIKGDNTDSYIYIDDISISEASCSAPTNLTTLAITSTLAQISWTSGGSGETAWEYVVQPVGTGVPAGAGTASSNNNAGINNLMPNTNYEFYVRAKCGTSAFSPWSSPGTFTTLCEGYAIPYFEGFEEGYQNYELLTGCFLQENDDNGYPWKSFSDTDNPHTGNGYAYNGGVDWLFIPVQLTAGTNYYLEVYARKDGNINPTLTLGYGTQANGMAMNTIVNATTLNDNYQSVSGTFFPTTTGLYYIGILGNNTDSYTYIDDIIINTDDCPTPTNLTTISVGSSTAQVSWNTGGSASEWEVIAQPQGSGTPIVAGTSTTANPYTINGLNDNTNYEFYVRTKCSGNNFSPWSVAGTFTTLTDFCTNTTFADPGGTSSNYASNANTTTVICPSNANQKVSVSFSSFELESDGTTACNDQLMIYNGANTNAPVIPSPGIGTDGWCFESVGDGTGELAGKTIASTDDSGCLTFVFTSDDSIEHSGWEAIVDCNTNEPWSGVLPYSSQEEFSTNVYITGDGWHHFHNNTHLLLSLKTGNTGAQTNTGAVSVDPDTGTDAFFVPGVAGNFISNSNGAVLMRRKWDVLPSISPDTNVPVRFYYTTEEYNAVNTELANQGGTPLNAHTQLQFYKVLNGTDPFQVSTLAAQHAQELDNGTQPSNDTWVYNAFNNAHFAEMTVSSFSGGGGGGTSGGNTLLPIELQSFTGRALENSNQLQWTTSTELNTHMHYIERKALGKTAFEEIGGVPAIGFSQTITHYELEDATPLPTAYYRLKTVDLDGSIQYSSEILIQRDREVFDISSAFPNPFNEYFTINLSTSAYQQVTLTLTNITGEVLATNTLNTHKGSNSFTVNTAHLPTGVYFITAQSNDAKVVKRLIKN